MQCFNKLVPDLQAVTLKTLSDRLSIHSSLISRVLRGDPLARISKEKRDEILKVANELGYRPNHTARALRTKRTNVLALTVPDITNPFYAVLFRAIEEVALGRGYSLVLCNTDEREDRFEKLVERLADGRVDGWLIATARSDARSLQSLKKTGTPYVLVNRRTDEPLEPWVGPNDVQTGRLAAEHLIGLGHRKIAYISADVNITSMRKRYEGFVDASRELGVEPDPRLLISGVLERQAVRAQVDQMLNLRDHRPTAFFVSNSRAMEGTLAALRMNDLLVPGDISVLGYDPFHEALVSAIVAPVQTIGKLAADRLIDVLEDIHSRDEPLKVELPVQLVDHGTTGVNRR